ncbi:MAG: hypothetical protein FJ387_14070 [Verrucomicrobia bacterium]|nr:hypothetical protein [Verrucomicrobiota bacterium]
MNRKHLPGCAAALAMAVAVALAAPIRAAEPKVTVAFTDQGDLLLTLDGRSISQPTSTLDPLVRFRDPAAKVPYPWGATDQTWPVDSADVRPQKSEFDTKGQRLVQTFAWGEVVRTYRVVAGGVNVEVTVHNKSSKTLCEFQQRLFTLKLPYETGPAMTTEALFFGQAIPAQSGDTLSGPVALPLVGGAGYADSRGKSSRAIVATTPETKRHLALRWNTDTWVAPWERERKLTGYALNDPVAMDLARRQQEEESAAKGEIWSEFRDRLLKQADGLVARMKATDAQGVIIWNIEGNGPSYMKYAGDPHMVEFMCPEADAVANEFFKKIRDAGFKVGVCLRPSVIAVGELAKNPWLKAQFPGAQSSFAYYHDYPHKQRTPADILSAKVAYAKKRWGCTLFYVDTNDGAGWWPETAEEKAVWPKNPDGSFMWYHALLNEDVWAEVLKRHPDVLFTIEHTPLIQYTVNAPYDEWSSAGDGTPSVVRATWPEAFKCLVIKEPKDHWQVAAKVRDGDVLACDTQETTELLNRLGVTLRLGPPKELTGLTPARLLTVATDPQASEPMRFFAAKQLCGGEPDAATVDKLLAGNDRLVQLLAVESLKSRVQLKAQIPHLTRLPGGLHGFFGGPLRDAVQRGGPEFLRDLTDYARSQPADGGGVANMLWVTPGNGATEQLAALVTGASLPEEVRLIAVQNLGWRKDASAAEKDVALGFLLPMLGDPKARSSAAAILQPRYVWGHGLWNNDPRVLEAVKAAADKEKAQPKPDAKLLEVFHKIIKCEQ